MNAPTKIVVTSGRRMDQGKTSFTDNVLAPRLQDLVRVEIESASTGSAKPGVHRIPATKLNLLRDALLDLDDDQALACDVGGAEYADFMLEMTKHSSTAAEFDRFIFLMSAAGSIKQADALASIKELFDLGADPEKVSVVFNFAPFVVGIDALRANLKAQFGSVFDAAASAGFHVCETPIVHSEALYKTVFASKVWTIDGLAAAESFRAQIKALKREGKEVPDELRHLEAAQSNATSYAKANLDAVWAEIVAAHSQVA